MSNETEPKAVSATAGTDQDSPAGARTAEEKVEPAKTEDEAKAAAEKTEPAAPKGETKAAPKKVAKADGEAAEVKKPKAPEPEVKPEDMADANALFKKIFDVVEIKRRLDRAVIDEVERGHTRLMQRVADEAKDLAAWDKKVQKALTEFTNAAQLGGGEARLFQLTNKLSSIKQLLADARKLT
ncbi:MAG: hypothetical protein ABIJ09_26770 [Pseudomonadota bacterium]